MKNWFIPKNVLNNTKVFYDNKNNDSVIKSNEEQYMACEDGKFYDMERKTQKNLGTKYYFDNNKILYIMRHEKNIIYSNFYIDTNMD